MGAFYELNCTDCSFQTVVAGEFEDVFDEIERHRKEQEADTLTHFVNVHRY